MGIIMMFASRTRITAMLSLTLLVFSLSTSAENTGATVTETEYKPQKVVYDVNVKTIEQLSLPAAAGWSRGVTARTLTRRLGNMKSLNGNRTFDRAGTATCRGEGFELNKTGVPVLLRLSTAISVVR